MKTVRQIISIICCLIVLFCTIAAFTCGVSVVNKDLLYKMAVNSLFKETIFVNSILKIGKRNEAPVRQSNKKSDNDRSAGLLLFLMGSIITVNQNALLVVLVISLAFVINTFAGKFTKDSDFKDPPENYDIGNYVRWVLKFMTPLERCVQSIAQKYSANPLSYGIVGETARVLILRIKNAGFFYGVTQWT